MLTRHELLGINMNDGRNTIRQNKCQLHLAGGLRYVLLRMVECLMAMAVSMVVSRTLFHYRHHCRERRCLAQQIRRNASP